MKILFDHQTYCAQKIGGISRYFTNIIQHIEHQEKDIQYELSLRYSDNIYLSQIKTPVSPPPFLLQKNFKGKKFILERINRYYTQQALNNNQFDVFFPTYYHTYFLKCLKKPYILTVHDMTHEKFPEIFKKKNDFTLLYKRTAIEKASHIIAISENTRKDLQEIYQISDSKISTIHHGIATNFQFESVKNLPESYFLFVGDRGGYKNFETVISALSLLEDKNVQLICTGQALSQAEEQLIHFHQLHNRVKSYSLTDLQLNDLYQNALALIYPSMYEGFGYPLLEAMRANCLVISSNTSCLPEIGGDAAIYFNPLEIEELKSKMTIVLHFSKQEKLEWLEKGKKNLQLYTLEKSMQKTIQTISKIV